MQAPQDQGALAAAWLAHRATANRLRRLATGVWSHAEAGPANHGSSGAEALCDRSSWQSGPRFGVFCVLIGLLSCAWLGRGEVLLRETFSREYSLHVGGVQTPMAKDLESRELSLFVGAEPASPYAQAVSRELSFVVTTPAAPDRVTQLNVAVSPTGDTAALDWSGYNEIAQHDVIRYRVYVSTAPLTSVSDLAPSFLVSAGTSSLTITNLPPWQDHYFAVVAEDALGGFDTDVSYSAAYVLAPQAISRELSLFVGAEPVPPYPQAISRELSVLTTTPEVPARVEHLLVIVSPTGDTVTLDWSAYNEIAEHDVVAYRIFAADVPFASVASVSPSATVPAGTFSLTITNLAVWQDHYFAVVPVDGLGGYDPNVAYAAAHVLAPQVASRELSLFVGAEPASPYQQAIAREVTVLVPDALVPDPVTGLDSGFAADTSTTAFSAIDLDWSSYNEVAQHDVVKYRIYAAGEFFTDVSSLSPIDIVPAGTFRHTVTGLHGTEVYYVAVVAEDALGQWNPTVRSISALASIGALGEVKELAATSLRDALEFTWIPPNQLDAFLARYHVYFAEADTPTVVDKFATHYEADGLSAATGYSFRIATVDTFGTESAGVTVRAATWLDNPSPVSADTFDGRVRLTWPHVESNDLVAAYSVYAADVNFADVSGMTPVLTTNGTRLDITGLQNGKAYYFSVTTVNISGGEQTRVDTVTATPNPVPGNFADLAVGTVSAPAAAYGGETVAISWSVTNVGPGPTGTKNGAPVDSWADRIVLSPDSTFGNANDVVLTNLAHTGTLASGEGYSAVANVSLPTERTGSYFVFVLANADGEVYEHLDSAPDLGLATQRLVIRAPVPPFITQQPEDQTVFAGYPASFNVDVGGSPPLAFQWWHDGAILPGATDATLVLDNPQLADAGGYFVQISNPGGETNSQSVALTVNPPPPDLMALGIVAPASLLAGQPVSFSWVVTNAGPTLASAPWQERLLLATGSTGDNAILLYTFTNNVALVAGGSVTRTQTVILPVGLSGSYGLALQMDTADQVVEGYGETNNLYVDPRVIEVVSPDLQVGELASAATAVFGEPLSVSWTISNSGSGAAVGNWNDRIWLSPQADSLNGATRLASQAGTALPAGASYTRVATVSLPLTAQSQAGAYWLVAQTDAGNAVPESDEGNNLRSVRLELSLPPLADLSVGECLAPGTALPGETISVSWAVTNLGPAALNNQAWEEQVILTNPAPGGASLLLGTFVFTNTLAPGDWLNRTQEVEIPAASDTGERYCLIVVDSGNRIVEGDESNNTTQSPNAVRLPARLTVSAPASLREGELGQGMVTRNGNRSSVLTVNMSASVADEISFDSSSAISTTTVTIPAGATSAQFTIRALTDGVVDGPQSVQLTAAAMGFDSGTATVTVVDVDLPPLSLALETNRVWEGSALTATVSRGAAASNPLTVIVDSSNASQLSPPAFVTIPSGAASADFSVLAVDDNLVEGTLSYSLSVSAPGYVGVTTNVLVFDNDLPEVWVTLASPTVSEGDGPQATWGTVTRNISSGRPLVVELESSNPAAALVPAQVTIPANQYSVNFPVAAVNDDQVNGSKTASIRVFVLASGTSTALFEGLSAQLTVTDDDGPTLKIVAGSKLVAEGLSPATPLTVSRNTIPTEDLVVALTSSDPSEATVPPSVTIPAGTNATVVYLTSVADGVTDGNQSVLVTASAPDYVSGVETVVVSDTDLPDLVVSTVTAPTAAETDTYVSVGYRVSNQGLGPTGTNFLVRVYLAKDALGNDPVLAAQATFDGTIPVGMFYEQTLQVRLPQAAGSYWPVVEVDAGQQVAEVLEDNNVSVNAVPIVSRAAYGAWVQTPLTTALANTPVPLSGRATNWFGAGVPSKLVNLHILTRGTERIISVLTDAGGNFATTWQPLPGEAGFYQIFATHPGVSSVPVQDEFRLVGMRAAPATASFTVVEGATKSGSVTIENLSDLPLTGLAVALVSAPAGLTVTAELASGNSLAGVAKTALIYSVSPATPQAFGNVTLRVTSTEGASVDVSLAVSVEPLRPRLVATPGTLVAGMVRGRQRIVEFKLANEGGIPTGPITVALPSAPWLSLATTNPLPPLAPGETNATTVALMLTPAVDQTLGAYTGSLALNSSNASLTVPFNFRALSEAKGDLLITAVDELTYYAEGAPNLAGASVSVRDAVTGASVASGVTDANGQFFVAQLPEAYYELELTADKHTTYRGTQLVQAGQTNEVTAFLSRQTVTYTWTVEPIQIEDRYKITVETTFETVVPLPVVTIDPPVIDLAEITTAETQVMVTITNHGLIAANNTRLSFPTHPLWEFRPLLTQIGTLPAHSGLTIPLIIRKVEPPRDLSLMGREPKDVDLGPCYTSAYVCWKVECGTLTNTYCGTQYYPNARPGCGGSPPTPPGGGCVGCGGGVTGGGGKTYVTSPAYTTPSSCDPCLEKRILAVAKCAISWIPIPLPKDVQPIYKCLKAGSECVLGLPDGLDQTDAYKCTKAGLQCLAASKEVTKKILIVLKIVDCVCNIFSACQNVPGHDSSNIESLAAGICNSVGITSAGKLMGRRRVAFESTPELEPLEAQLERARAVADYLAYLCGSYDWFHTDDGQEDLVQSWLENLTQAIEDPSDSGRWVSLSEQAQLLALPLPANIVTDDAVNLIDRWNRSLDYWDQGIFNLNQVPGGQSTNFIAIDVLKVLASKADAAMEESEQAGYTSVEHGLTAEIQKLYWYYLSQPDANGICARVKLRTEQEAVVTRDAFRATLEIENQDAARLENVAVTLTVTDADGEDRTSLFGIRSPELVGISAVDGTGILAGTSTGTAKWVIIPTSDAAPTNATQYYVSGRLDYTQAGTSLSVPLAPVAITVLPNPRLFVDYFHERDVFSDDPFTDQVEPSIPFNLAVMVQNRGYGTAKNFHITSAQPQIVENEKGLLIDFQIIATEVAGKNLVPSLTADFGDIAPGQTEVGRWLMTSTLQGLFTDYKATFEHIDALGDLKLSLLEDVRIHEMIHLVRAGGGLEDGKPDFLVNDVPDVDDLPDTLWLSDGRNFPVQVVRQASADNSPNLDRLQVQLTAAMPGGWVYLRVPDPQGATGDRDYVLVSVRRSDGTSVPTEDFWQTDRTFIGLGRRPIRENVLHLLDDDSTGEYTLVYEPVAVPPTLPPSSVVSTLPAISPAAFPVQWSGQSAQGRPLRFDVWVSTEGGPFVRWLQNSSQPSAVFAGEVGKHYAFYSQAIDEVGNREAAHNTPDAQTTVGFLSSTPTLSAIPDVSTDEDLPIAGVAVTVEDADTPLSELTFTVSSSNPTLVSAANVSILGTGNDRTLNILPASGRTGSGQITLTVSDGSSQTSRTFKLVVNPVNHPPVAGADSVTRQHGQALKILASQLLSNDQDVDFDPLMVTAVSPLSAQGVPVQLVEGWVAYLPSSDMNETDTFSYTVSDGHGGEAAGQVSVQVAAPGDQQSINITGFEMQNDHSIRIEFVGIPGRTYQIQATDTLSPPAWAPIGLVVADAFGRFEFIDNHAAEHVTRFYRSAVP